MEIIILKYGNLMGTPDIKKMLHELGPESKDADKLWDDLAEIKLKMGMNGRCTSALLLEPDSPDLFPAVVDLSYLSADPDSFGEQSVHRALDAITGAGLKLHEIKSCLITHPHPDHLNGLKFIASSFKADEFWENGQEYSSVPYLDLMDILAKRRIRRVTVHDEPRARPGGQLTDGARRPDDLRGAPPLGADLETGQPGGEQRPHPRHEIGAEHVEIGHEAEGPERPRAGRSVFHVLTLPGAIDSRESHV